jgi:hypothetical protein
MENGVRSFFCGCVAFSWASARAGVQIRAEAICDRFGPHQRSERAPRAKRGADRRKLLLLCTATNLRLHRACRAAEVGPSDSHSGKELKSGSARPTPCDG